MTKAIITKITINNYQNSNNKKKKKKKTPPYIQKSFSSKRTSPIYIYTNIYIYIYTYIYRYIYIYNLNVINFCSQGILMQKLKIHLLKIFVLVIISQV